MLVSNLRGVYRMAAPSNIDVCGSACDHLYPLKMVVLSIVAVALIISLSAWVSIWLQKRAERLTPRFFWKKLRAAARKEKIARMEKTATGAEALVLRLILWGSTVGIFSTPFVMLVVNGWTGFAVFASALVCGLWSAPRLRAYNLGRRQT